MSKTFRSFLFVFAVVIQILHLFNNSNAQDLDVNIKLDAAQPQIVTIAAKRKVVAGKQPSRNLSFLTSIAGAELSGERISNLKLFDSKGTPVTYKRFIPGEYVAEAEFAGWSYQVDLTPPKDQKMMARVSWMTKTTGILMLDDLLQQFSKNENIGSATVIFEFPEGSGPWDWPIQTSIMPGMYRGKYPVSDIRKAVFYIGNDWECGDTSEASVRKTSATVSTCYLGDVHLNFHAGSMAIEIYRDYQTRFGGEPSPVAIAIIKLSDNVAPDTWEAETRGRTITILTSDTLFKSQALQQLHEQLRHEIFHLWFPNGVNLSGNYDWFYEGFSLYQSLKTGVVLNRIRFDDYLDTLSRAYDIDKRRTQKPSLIEASKNRWTGDNNTQVYARGMLVAFLCDLALLEKSKGKRSVTDLLRKLYERYKPPKAEQDGNTAVLALLRSYSELAPIIDRNINGSESIEWNELLKGAGLEVESTDQAVKLKVAAKPSGRQKDLLDELGYNNWRKLSSK